MIKTLLILSLAILAIAMDRPQLAFRKELVRNIRTDTELKTTADTQWFDQIVDHFNYQQQKTWRQRYWAFDQSFKSQTGPVFLFICGQFVCENVLANRQWILQLSQKLNGIVLMVQHRFYGNSLPFGKDSFSLQNLKYLTSEQALSDLAYFTQQIKANNMFNISDNNPWISVGGSYPGALSAWYRLKYPHLTVGAIASSAVVMAIEDFPEFDQQMYNSSMKSGPWCSDALNQSSIKVQKILNSSQGAAFKAKFQGGDKLKDKQFLFFWVDAIVMQIQYGNRVQFCKDLKPLSSDDQFNYIVENIVSNHPVYEYGSYYLSNVTRAQEVSGTQRCWYYQSCTQFGYWQTMSPLHPLRSAQLNLDFYKQFCSDAYGVGTWPKVQRKNLQYGALQLKATNLLMINGQQDPWRWASLQKSQGNVISRVANCDNCAHCVDLNTPSTDDPIQLKNIREEQYVTVMNWIDTYWKNKQVSLASQ